MNTQLQTVWNRIVTGLRDPAALIRGITADGLEFSTASLDKALARISDLLGRPEIHRVEVGIGRDLADATNPEDFRHRVDGIARSFVRRGKAGFALSINWADVLDDQSLIHVQVFVSDEDDPTAAAPLKPKKVDTEVLKKELVAEVDFGVKTLRETNSGPMHIAALTVICRDSDLHPVLEKYSRDREGWNRSFQKLLVRTGAVPIVGFRANYCFDSKPEGTVVVGQGWLSIELELAGGDNDRTVVLGQTDDRPLVHVRWVGLGSETFDTETPLALPLPGVIDRSLLAKTALARRARACLQAVSQRYPLHVGLDNGGLTLTVDASNGASPKIFLIDNGKETPVIGTCRLPHKRAEVLIGGESWRTASAPDGQILRPVRIELKMPDALH